MGVAAAGMVFAACSNDETVEMAQNSNAIQFQSFVNKSTRGIANDATANNFTNFKVWGLMNKGDQTGKPFDGVEVSKTGDTWGYGTPVYWEKGYAYSFVALAPNNAYTFTAPTAINTWGSLTFENKTGETDLLYATAKSPVWDGGSCPAAVNLNFNHMLSRVKFAFTNSMDDGSTINVTNVTITDAKTNGTANLAEEFNGLTWNAEGTGNLEFKNVKENDDANAEDAAMYEQNITKATDHKYMIPAESAYTVTFIVTRTHNGVTDTYDHTVTIPSTKFEAGKSYKFVAKLNSENIDPETELCPIKFTANVTGWEKFGDETLTIPAKEEEGE